MTFDSPDSIADWLENQLLWRNKVRLPNDYIEVIKKISAKEITEMMQQHWNLKKLNLLVQGPVKNKEESIQKFTNYLKDL